MCRRIKPKREFEQRAAACGVVAIGNNAEARADASQPPPTELDNIMDGRLANYDRRRIGQGRLTIWAGRVASARQGKQRSRRSVQGGQAGF
jgi:hypothetical protein